MANRDTRALVAHLFRRAGFGLRPDELDHFTALGVQGSVDYLTAYQGSSDPAEATYPVPELTQYNSVLMPGKHTTAELKAVNKLRVQAIYAVQEWWVNRMLTTARPLQEKMTLFGTGTSPPRCRRSTLPRCCRRTCSSAGWRWATSGRCSRR